MGYMRDGDRHTRGIGAIAAFDRAPARQQRRVQTALATRARDRAMAAVARGALGVVNRTGEPADETPPIYAPRPTPTTVISGGGVSPVMWHPTPDPAPAPPMPAPVVWKLPGAVKVYTETPPIAAPSGGGILAPSGAVMGAPIMSPPIVAPVRSPPIYAEEPDPAQADTRLRNALLIGGGAIAAYFIFFRRKKP